MLLTSVIAFSPISECFSGSFFYPAHHFCLSFPHYFYGQLTIPFPIPTHTNIFGFFGPVLSQDFLSLHFSYLRSLYVQGLGVACIALWCLFNLRPVRCLVTNHFMYEYLWSTHNFCCGNRSKVLFFFLPDIPKES